MCNQCVRPGRYDVFCVGVLCLIVFVLSGPMLLAGEAASVPSTRPVRAPATRPVGEAEQKPTAEAKKKPEQVPAEAAEHITLEEVVITATRRFQEPFELPYTTHAISSKDITDSFFRTTPEALRELPAVMVQKTSHGQGSPFIRGFTGFHNLFLIDGIRLNNSVFRPGPNQYWNTVDPLSVDRLEVIKGPTSVLYGSDAIGGTVNAITKSPTGYGEGFRMERRMYYRFSTAERSHVGRFELNMTMQDKLGLLFGASVKDFGALRAGHGTGRQPNTGYGEWDADFKLEYFFNRDTRLVVAYQQVQQNNVPRTHRTIFAKSFRGTTIGSDRKRNLDQDRKLVYVQLHAENIGSLVETMRLSLSWQEQHETRDRVRGNWKRDLQGFDVGTFGFGAQFESPTPIGYLTYGIEYYHDNVNSFSTRNRIQGPVADDASYDLLGLYIQDEIPLGDRLDLILGGRANYARAHADSVRDPVRGTRFSFADEWWSLVGSARLVYHLVPQHINIFGGVSQGFRAPNLSDLTRFDTARTNEIETPVSGLDPEKFISYEVGIKTHYDNWSMQAAYFYTAIDDMIIRVPTGRVIEGDFEVTKVNAGDGFVQGFEFGTSYRFHPQWTVFGDLTWIDGEVDTFPTSRPIRDREPISRLMPFTSHVGLRWDHPSKKLWFEALGTFAGKQDDLSTRDRADTSRIPPGGTPGYAILSLRGGWRINEHADLTLAAENITNQDYRIHGSGVNEPGCSLNVGLSVRF